MTPERIAEDGNPIEEFLCYGNCQAVMRENEALKSELERLGAECEALAEVAVAAEKVRPFLATDGFTPYEVDDAVCEFKKALDALERIQA
jgi:hypothetical protein